MCDASTGVPEVAILTARFGSRASLCFDAKKKIPLGRVSVSFSFSHAVAFAVDMHVPLAASDARFDRCHRMHVKFGRSEWRVAISNASYIEVCYYDSFDRVRLNIFTVNICRVLYACTSRFYVTYSDYLFRYSSDYSRYTDAMRCLRYISVVFLQKYFFKTTKLSYFS